MAKSKKNLRKVPKFLSEKIKILEGPQFEAVAVVCYPKSKIREGKLKKFGISYEGDKLLIGGEFVPRSPAGKFSRINRRGKLVIRKDLPMVTKTYTFEAPNYGDWSKGSHEVVWERQVYQRDLIKPAQLKISSELVADRDEEIVVGFRVTEALNKSDGNLPDKLLFHLNLLQENFGTCDVVSRGEPLEEKQVYKKLKWEVLPPGWWSDKNMVERIRERLGSKQTQLFIERIKYVESLKPLEGYVGQPYLGSRWYFVFIFEKHVLAECPMFGNALYFLDGDKKDSWRKIFVQTKRTALKMGARRILHTRNWKKKLAELLS